MEKPSRQSPVSCNSHSTVSSFYLIGLTVYACGSLLSAQTINPTKSASVRVYADDEM